MSDLSSTPRTVARFADGLLADDLPRLPDDRRRDAIDFIGRRVRVLPSITRLGVLSIALVVHLFGAVFGHGRVRRVVLALPLPLLAEYPRLVRSLGYAFIWETWPATDVDGGTAEGRAA
jgi:hypothetical protein